MSSDEQAARTLLESSGFSEFTLAYNGAQAIRGLRWSCVLQNVWAPMPTPRGGVKEWGATAIEAVRNVLGYKPVLQNE